MLIAEEPRFASSMNSICLDETCWGRFKPGNKNPEQKNKTVTTKYTPKKEKKAYLGKRSAIIQAVNAGIKAIITKFLKRRIRQRKIIVKKNFFHKKFLFSKIVLFRKTPTNISILRGS